MQSVIYEHWSSLYMNNIYCIYTAGEKIILRDKCIFGPCTEVTNYLKVCNNHQHNHRSNVIMTSSSYLTKTAGNTYFLSSLVCYFNSHSRSNKILQFMLCLVPSFIWIWISFLLREILSSCKLYLNMLLPQNRHFVKTVTFVDNFYTNNTT